MQKYNLVAENPESTVVSDYQVEYRTEKEYQSEAELERVFIKLLTEQAYEYLPIHTEAELIANLRRQLEKLNGYTFTDGEWSRFFTGCIANKNSGIVEKTAIIQEDHVQLLTRDDGTVKNIYLLDKANIHNNSLQVINQYEVDSGARPNRYDVTVLVNGLPLAHIELKRRGVDIRDAFNQIDRYQRESFWAGSGLFEFVQLFVISNGTYTKYYSNTTRQSHIKEASGGSKSKSKQTSNSFEFTSWWADANNRPIADLMGFGRTFFAKHTLLNLLTRYCVFTSDRMLLVMRPYQVVATERILSKIGIADNYRLYGTVEGGGYVWHTTGSGKTLTSFKTAQLASKLPYIDKVLFVVDRKDLDYQTMREYDKFERGAANSNTSTAILKRQLEDPEAKIIITTIQKLSVFIGRHAEHSVFRQKIVIISTSATARNLAICTLQSSGDSNAISFSALQVLPFCKERHKRRQAESADDQAGVRRAAAHLYDRRCHQRQECAAIPHRVRSHHQGERGDRELDGMGHRPRGGFGGQTTYR